MSDAPLTVSADLDSSSEKGKEINTDQPQGRNYEEREPAEQVVLHFGSPEGSWN